MEQYIRLVGARQILHGELPDRDFLNRGFTLMYYAAAAAMAVFGDGLLGDLVLTAGPVSLGAALAWLLSYQASGSIFIAGVAALIAISSYSCPFPVVRDPCSRLTDRLPQDATLYHMRSFTASGGMLRPG